MSLRQEALNNLGVKQLEHGLDMLLKSQQKRIPHLSSKSTASLIKEYRISR
jgi:hypothetical protein